MVEDFDKVWNFLYQDGLALIDYTIKSKNNEN